MSAIDVDSDPSDSEIFVVKRIKPINKLTLQEALLIKHDVLHSVHSESSTSTKNLRKGNKRQRKEKNNENIIQSSKKVNRDDCKREDVSFVRADNKITKYFSPSKQNISSLNEVSTIDNYGFESATLSKIDCHEEVDLSKIEIESDSFTKNVDLKNKIKKEKEKKSPVAESVCLSPGVAKRKKKFNLSDQDSPKKKSTNCSPKSIEQTLKTFSSVSKNLNFNENSSTGKQTIKNTPEISPHMIISLEDNEKIFEDNGELLCHLLKKIVSDVIRKQINFEMKYSKTNKPIESLFSIEEYDILYKFSNLEYTYSKVCTRMLCRKKLWYRLSSLNFKDISNNLENIFKILSEKNLVKTNIDQADLKTQMDLLNKNEIQDLCKAFNVPPKMSNGSQKVDLIDKLIKSTQCQKSVVSMFKNVSKSLTVTLQQQVLKYLGKCVCLNEAVKNIFNKILLLFSFPHYFDEEEKRFRTQLYMCMSVHKNFVKYPNYQLSETVVFETLEDFEKYNAAIMLREMFEATIASHNFEDFNLVSQKIKNEFESILTNRKYVERYLCMKPFLQKFSAGHIYAKLLTKFCCKFKTKTATTDIIETLKILLNQNIFLLYKRGKWYEILAQSLESMKDSNSAGEILIESLNDPLINEVQKLTLQLRGQSLLKKKKNGITKANLREALDDSCELSVQEPPSIEIRGKALQDNKSGCKAIYIEETYKGKMYTSVEERALLHYKSNGYPKGYHVEGYIIQSIYALLFYDIIYDLSPPGVFQSSYQQIPLDMFSEYFYENRKEVIDKRLKEMCSWTQEIVENRLKLVYYQNFNTTCIIAWKENFTPDMFSEIVSCISLPVLTKICERFAKDFRTTKSGFPDLTLWNPETQKCKFVEVKSPNDKLSPPQRLWLDFLRKNGLDCEVCNVKNTARKSSI